MSITIQTIVPPNNSGLAVTAFNQAGPAALGPQKTTECQLSQLVIDTNNPVNPVSTQPLPISATLPAPLLAFRFDVPNTAGDVTLTVPFACKVIGAFAIKVGNGGAGDEVVIGATKLDNSSAAITGAIDLHVNNKVVAAAASIDYDAASSLDVGDTLTATATKVTDCTAVVYVQVVAL